MWHREIVRSKKILNEYKYFKYMQELVSHNVLLWRLEIFLLHNIYITQICPSATIWKITVVHYINFRFT